MDAPTTQEVMVLAVVPAILGAAGNVWLCYSDGDRGSSLVFVAVFALVLHWLFWIGVLKWLVSSTE